MFPLFTPVICLDEEFVRIAGCFLTRPPTLDTTRQSFILYFRFILILSSISILLPWILLDNLSFFTSGSYYTILNIRPPTLDTTRQSFILYFRFILYYPYSLMSIPILLLWILLDNLSIQSVISLPILIPWILLEHLSCFTSGSLILSLISLTILLPWIPLDNLSFFTSGSY